MLYLLKLILLFIYLNCVLCQFSLVSLPKSGRNSTKEPRINTPNTIIRIKVGPNPTFTNESISSLTNTESSFSSNLESSTLTKRSTDSIDRLNDSSKELASNKPKEQNTSARTPKYGFGGFSSFTDKIKSTGTQSFTDKIKSTGTQSFNDKIKQPKLPNFQTFSDKIKPTLPTELPNEFNKFANETANRIKDNPIVSKFLNIPNYFKVNSLKGAVDYMIKYGHLENMIDINKPEDLFNLKDRFKEFQEFFGLKQTGLFDQETLNLMNEKRCGLPDKETKFTNLVRSYTGGLIRKKRFELYNAKYETSNLTWTIVQFSKKALKNQDEQVIDVFKNAFQVWANVTNLNFEFKPNNNKSDILIGFYSGAHGNPHVEPAFDGQNGTLAHTSYPTEWDLHLDDDELWSLYPQGEHTDLFSVSIHELGHKFGLKHSKVKKACLYPIYNSKSTQLDQDDIQGIQSLYGAKNNEKEKEIIDANATEKPDPENANDNKLDDNVPDNNEPESKPDANKPDTKPDNRPNENNPPQTEKQAIKILDFNSERNIFNRREYVEQISTPCSEMKIDSSVCMLNNKCLIVAGDYSFWMNSNLRMVRRKRERTDELFKGLTGRIDSIYRDNDKIHIIQGRNVTTYDSFYSEPTNRTTLDQHFPGLPKHVKNVHSVFKKLSTGVIYIYSGELYWRYTKTYGLERIPRLTFIWGLPGKIRSVLHFNNGKSIYIKKDKYWLFDEKSNDLLSVIPGNIGDLNICKNENFSFLNRFH